MRIMFILISFNLLLSQSIGQSVEFFGTPQPGGLLFGIADNPKEILLNGEPIQFGEKGEFVIGFDRDDTSTYLLTVEMESGSYLKKIKLPEREYKIQRINKMKQKYVSPPKEVEERIIKERKITREAKSKIGEVEKPLYNTGFERPIKGGRISSVFGSQRILNGTPKNPHNGLDIAVPTGTPVKAMTDGKVLLSADNFYYAGNFIIIDHGHGLNSMYLHLNRSLVTEGQIVKKGEIVGEVGTTGRSTGPHLHWSVQWYDKRIDPDTVFEFRGSE
jgi:murein DD-endopeptidase MepM/ murein hydrolase activator NlpD